MIKVGDIVIPDAPGLSGHGLRHKVTEVLWDPKLGAIVACQCLDKTLPEMGYLAQFLRVVAQPQGDTDGR